MLVSTFFGDLLSSRSDPAVQLAVQKLKRHFTNKAGQPIKTPYYLSQLEILYENDFYPWVISDAVRILIEDGFLAQLNKSDICTRPKELPNIHDIHFLTPRKVVERTESRDLVIKHAYNTSRLVNDYSDPKTTRILGKHLEALVKAELRAQRFDIKGQNTNTFEGRTWRRTGHNLDLVVTHESGGLSLGVEVKNTLDLISPDEVDVKIEMCRYLGLIPVFAVRWIKPYIDCIRKQGGFSWVFKTQIYPLGYEDFTVKLYRRLSVPNRTDSRGHKLEFPIIVRTELPQKSIDKFGIWVRKVLKQPPIADTSVHCRGARRRAE